VISSQKPVALLKLLCLNVNGLIRCVENFPTEFEWLLEQNDVCVFVESHLRPEQVIRTFPSCTVLHKCRKSGSKGAISVFAKNPFSLTEIPCGSEDIFPVELRAVSRKLVLVLICVYFPPAGGVVTVNDEVFFECLDEVWRGARLRCELVLILGDFNARIGGERFYNSVGDTQSGPVETFETINVVTWMKSQTLEGAI